MTKLVQNLNCEQQHHFQFSPLASKHSAYGAPAWPFCIAKSQAG
jgi:hypothetical protein